MIIGHEDHEEACNYLRDHHRMTRQEALEVISLAEDMGWIPAGLAADEAAAAASNELAFRWKQPFEVRKSVVVSIYRRMLGARAEKRLLESEKTVDH
jgi:hypothetical protein